MSYFSALTTILSGLFLVSTSHASMNGQLPNPAGTFRDTYYYSVLEHLYASEPKVVDLLDMNDRVVATVSEKFNAALSIEGTGKLMDGRVINFQGRKNGTTRWQPTIHPYGRGIGNCALVPFRTIAVDPTRIALGSVIYIDETVGMKLPDGTIHDGIWRAEDIGSAIQHDRVDIFVGDGNQGSYLDAQGIGNLQSLTYRILAAPTPNSCLTQEPQ